MARYFLHYQHKIRSYPISSVWGIVQTINLKVQRYTVVNREVSRKKNSKYKKSESTILWELFKGATFSVGPHGLELYLNTKDQLGLYTSTQFMIGSDVTKCILIKKLIKPEVPTLEDEHMVHKKRVWEYRMSKLMKTVRELEGKLV